MINFTKMHGISNDFVVIDTTQQPFTPTMHLITAMANRKTGIGFDQLLLLHPTASQNADFDYTIYNADGSLASHCGNGARCIGLYLKLKQPSTDSFILQMSDRQIEVTHKQGQFTVNMGEPKFTIEPNYNTPVNNYHLTLNQQSVNFHVANVGNMHAIIFTDRLNKYNLNELGAEFNKHPSFPDGVNLSVAQIQSSTKIALQVYERGVGITQACGSAACAVMATAKMLEKVGNTTTIAQSGGNLSIQWKGPTHNLFMQGDATLVYHGVWPNN